LQGHDRFFIYAFFFLQANQAATFLRNSSGKAISLRHKDADMICFPRSVTLHLRVWGILLLISSQYRRGNKRRLERQPKAIQYFPDGVRMDSTENFHLSVMPIAGYSQKVTEAGIRHL